jgi:acetyl-CoA acetyltransferase
MLTTQFFATKIQRYMHLYGITPLALARVAEKNYHNGALAEHAWRRTPVDLDTILHSQMVSDPLTKYMFCSPAEGAVALVLASEARARAMGAPIIRLEAAAMRTRPPHSFEVFSPAIDIERGGTATMLASRAAFEAAGVGPEDIDVAQIQDTESGAEIMHMAENGFCADGEQEAWLAEGAPGWTARCRSTPTAAASPAASRSAPRACARCTRMSCSCVGPAARARCRATRRSPIATSRARPASLPSRS